MVTGIRNTIDVNTGEKKEATTLEKNEIAVCELKFADSIVVDAFSKHKTLGELILIDRITNMTSACGVITQTYKDDSSATDFVIDRETRSNWKGQRAITVEFKESEQVTLEYVKRVEKELSNRGRHTYLFAPKTSHGIKGIVKHLNDAGIVVLLFASNQIDTSVFESTRGYISDWKTEDIKTPAEAAEYVYKASAINNTVVTDGEYI